MSPVPAREEDERWMRAALALARRGLGRVAPNPSVGCLILKDGRMLGRGVTMAGGRPHAETSALANAAALYGHEAVAGATAYVTLEPCAHHGLTPPCSDALIEARVARVVCPIEDPDPRVCGAGIAKLRAAGVAVTVGPMAAEARALNAGFLSRHERGRPWLSLKLAATLDGRIATAGGESRWITGPEARRAVHLMRAEADAVLVGSGTALADDPMLDVRGFGEWPAQPVRVVADSRLALPLESRLATTARRVPVWLLHAAEAPAEAAEQLSAMGVHPVEVPGGPGGGLDLGAAMRRLALEGITRVMCEGGGRLAAGLLSAGLVDEIALFQAGAAIGAEGRPVIGDLGITALSAAPRFELAEIVPVGGDLLAIWRRPG